MTPQEKELIRTSYVQIEADADRLGRLFYQHLFEVAPHYRPLFQHSIEGQGEKLMQTIGVAVEYLDALDSIGPTLQDMGQRHIRYGVRPADYEVVGAVLLWTLEKGLGPLFTPDVKAAWANIYRFLVRSMQVTTAA